jgi:hypothetical protein
MGKGSSCSPDNPCTDQDDLGACCRFGLCTQESRATCTGASPGTYITFTEGGSCSSGFCNPTQTVACCNGSTCTEVPQSQCGGGGVAKGSSCSVNPCVTPPTGGSCCFTDSICSCGNCVTANNVTECQTIAASAGSFNSTFTPEQTCAEADCESYCCCRNDGVGCCTIFGEVTSQQGCDAGCFVPSTYKKCSECCAG